MKVKVKVTQLCPTLCDPMDCCLSGSSVHGIFQARVLGGVPLPSLVLIMRSHLILIYLPEAQFPNTITLGSRASTHEFSGETTQSTAIGN